MGSSVQLQVVKHSCNKMCPSFLFICGLLLRSSLALTIQDVKRTFDLPMSCDTMDGQACAFPYMDSENGVEVNQCVNSRCPTEIDSETLEAKEWATCDQSSCVIDCHTMTRKRCVFPFHFDENDEVWNRRCAKNLEGVFVCATKVNPDTNVGLTFEACNMEESCPLD